MLYLRKEYFSLLGGTYNGSCILQGYVDEKRLKTPALKALEIFSVKCDHPESNILEWKSPCASSIYILIQNGCPFPMFPAHLHLQIHMLTSSLSSYLAASVKSATILFQQIVTLMGKRCRYCIKFTDLSGNTWETAKIAHESHNDVRRLYWHAGAIFVLLAELGLRKPPRFAGRRLHHSASVVVKQSP